MAKKCKCVKWKAGRLQLGGKRGPKQCAKRVPKGCVSQASRRRQRSRRRWYKGTGIK